MSWYRASTISLTNGSTAVTGAATDFIANCAVGEGLLAPDGKVYEIAAIVSATALTLGSAYLGSTASGQSYAIIPSQSYLRDLALQAATLVNDYQSVLDSAGAGKFDDGTLGSPGIQFSSDSNTGLRRTGTDAVALVTGGVDRITVDAAGAVAVVASLSVAGSAVPTLTSTSTLTNKTLTAPVLANPSYSGATANGGTVTTIDINGGTIDGTVIGGTTPAAVSATTLSASGTTSGSRFYGNTTGITEYMDSLGTTGVYSSGATAPIPNSVALYVAGASIATATSTGLAVTGALSASGTSTQAAINASGVVTLSSNNGIPLRLSGATTGTNVLRASNTGGEALFGQENSTGNNLIIGASAYDTVVRGQSGLAFSANAGGAMQMRLSSTGLTVTGTLSCTGNTTLGDAAGDTLNVANGSLRLDASGNLGLGVTPTTAAVGVARSLHIGEYTVFGQKSDGAFHCGQNYYEYTSNGYKYSTSFYATRYEQQSGQHVWYTAPSGTAGNAITFTQAMTLDASGNLGLGVVPNGTEKALIFPDTLSIKVSLNGQVTGNYYTIEKRAAVSGGDGAFKFVAGNTAAGEFVFSSGGSNKAVLDASGNLSATGGITTGSYTVATRPAHAAGRIIHVTDGGAGAVFQGSAGGAWVNLG